MDAVRAGLVEFAPAQFDRTTVIFRLEESDGGPPVDELKRQIGHDLVVFKDYVERSGLAKRKHTRRGESGVRAGVRPQGRQTAPHAPEQRRRHDVLAQPLPHVNGPA